MMLMMLNTSVSVICRYFEISAFGYMQEGSRAYVVGIGYMLIVRLQERHFC